MKNLFYLLLVSMLLFTSCGQPTGIQEKPQIEPKFKNGELVYVGDNEYIVRAYTEYDNQYLLKKVDCKSSECLYWVLESEIRKTKDTVSNGL